MSQSLSKLTQHHLCRRLGRKPENDECQTGEQDARQNEDIVVEDRDTLEPDSKGQIGIRLFATRVVFDVLDGRMTDPVSYTHLTLPTNREV